MRSVRQKGNAAIIVIVILLIAVTGLAAYIIGQNSSKFMANTSKTPASTDATNKPDAVMVPTPTPVKTPDAVPKENALYLGTYKGKEALYFTNKQEQRYFEPGAVEKTDPMVGQIRFVDGGGEHPVNYKNITEPKRIQGDFGFPIQMVNGFSYTSAKSHIYLSIILSEAGQYPDNALNKVYLIKTSDLTIKEIWSNKVGSDKYPGKGAVAIAATGDDKFAALTLFECYACGGHNPTKTIIVNATTKAEKFLEMIGNIKFDLPGGTFSYQKLAPFYEPCEPGPMCDNGKFQILKPTGATYSEKLP